MYRRYQRGGMEGQTGEAATVKDVTAKLEEVRLLLHGKGDEDNDTFKDLVDKVHTQLKKVEEQKEGQQDIIDKLVTFIKNSYN